MKKKIKKILIISDDFQPSDEIVVDGIPEFVYDGHIIFEDVESGIYFFNEEDNNLKFKIDLITSFRDYTEKKKYDAVLIDYGLIGRISGKDDIDIVVNIYNSGIKIAWIGGLADKYNSDAKELFPEYPFLHNLPTAYTGDEDLLYLLYNMFNSSRKV